MKKVSKLMTIVIAAVLAIGTTNCAAMSSPANFKYAVVDVQKVVSASTQVSALKNQQNQKMRELSKFVQDANKKLAAESNAQKKQALEASLNKEFEAKKVAIEKDYAAKLSAIDKNITAIISQKAKQKGYDLVLAKGIVLYSTGVDITDEVIQSVK